MSKEEMRRPCTVAVIQCGGYGEPASEDLKKNLKDNLELVDKACQQYKPDYVSLSELFTLPYFCGIHDTKFFKWAETIPGPTTDLLAEKAKQHKCNIIAGIFEKSEIEGLYYNSAVLIGRDGKLVEGTLPDGRKVRCYRKNHLPTIYYGAGDRFLGTDEKYYFALGSGFPIFNTDKGRVGILVCYDRSFPEAYRTLALMGAEMVHIIVASWGFRDEHFQFELRAAALENGVYIIGNNKGGREVLSGDPQERVYFGYSQVIDPFGKVLITGPLREGPAIIGYIFDIAELEVARQNIPLIKDRRPEIYWPVTRLGFP